MNQIYKHSNLRLFLPQYILTWLMLPILWIIGRIPHRLIIKIGQFIGKILYLFFPKRKQIIRTNLKLCFPDKSDQEIELLLKQNLVSLAIGICETAMAWFGSHNSIKILESKVEIINLEAINNVLNQNKPLLIFTPHAWSQELLSKVLSRKIDYMPVFRHMNNPVANYIMQKARLKIYKNLILKANPRQIIKSLQQNRVVAILPDQDFGRRRSIFVPFFNVPAATTTSLSKYKKLTDATIISLSYLRNPDPNKRDHFTIYVSDPLEITGTDLEKDARILNAEIETIINRDPSMYFWVARRFKTRPLGEPSVYKKR